MTRAAWTHARRAEIVALSWALGMALYTSVYFVLYLIGIPLSAAVAPALVVAVAGVTIGMIALRRARARDAGDSDDTPDGAPALVVVGLGIAAVQTVVTVWIALGSLLRFDDAWTVWATKALLFVYNGPPPGYFHQQPYASHPNYPLNLPLAEALFFRLPAPLGLRLAALVSTACLIALLLLFYGGLTLLYGRALGALAVGALTIVPSLPRFAGYGYADVPVALYGGGAALYLLLWRRRRRRVDLVLMGLLAGGAIWTKKEGLPIALLLLLALAITEARRRDAPLRGRGGRIANVLRATAATLALSGPWLLFTAVARPVGSDFQPLTPAVFVANAHRLPHIVARFVQETGKVDRWSLLWMLLALVLIGMARRLSPCGRLLAALLAAQLGVYLVGYVFSDWLSYDDHIGSSLNRLMIQAVPLAVLVIVEAVHPLPRPLISYPARRSRAAESRPIRRRGEIVREG